MHAWEVKLLTNTPFQIWRLQLQMLSGKSTGEGLREMPLLGRKWQWIRRERDGEGALSFDRTKRPHVSSEQILNRRRCFFIGRGVPATSCRCRQT